MNNRNRADLIGAIASPFTIIAEGRCIRFTLATEDRWYDRESGELRKNVQYHRVEQWGAEKVKTLARLLGSAQGRLVAAEGRMVTRQWKDRDQIERRETFVSAHNIIVFPKDVAARGSADERPRDEAPADYEKGWPDEGYEQPPE